MERIIKKEGKTRDEAYTATQKTGPQTYAQHLRLMIAASSKLHSETGATHVIFLDKNHPNQKGVEAALRDVNNNFSSKSVVLKRLFLVPELAVTN